MAAAQLCILRLDASRVLLADALSHGTDTAGERFAELTERLFGTPAPRALLAVLPQLRPGDAPSLVGAVMAAQVREAMVSRYDEDWFRNPSASEALRHEDTLPEAHAPPDEQNLTLCVALTARNLEEQLG